DPINPPALPQIPGVFESLGIFCLLVGPLTFPVHGVQARAHCESPVTTRGRLTTHGALRAIGDHRASVSLPKLKKCL
ncbi:unnamed protein product, partial [Staurois parvus]